ncbi:DNA polymerase III subunit gamma/tau [Candidatus Dependentiae bacterium]|nr:DNA polymerase III subunit gamma/tau [Candidatus Dependentiae bacterium]
MNIDLNLARKWRPKNFEQIIGQKIPVKILQNSLFLKKLFPVYLFAGQRGCGKTTTARVFGAAVNCKKLNAFQKNPTEFKIPCLKCESCFAMLQTNHPDFIEIDAASHTGVENVRQILESCSYMPILGKKKIYLIDEAHMLSKAAFNAFLKVLEEPPSNVLFILATTEKQKFPETVLSRCFQVIFKLVSNLDLEKHLKNICIREKIVIDPDAIQLIVQDTEGSVRDAINLLERVRFSSEKITAKMVLNVLGKISEKELIELFEILLNQKTQKLIDKFNSNEFQDIDPSILWSNLIKFCRALIWIKFQAKQLPNHFSDLSTLKQMADKCSVNRIHAILQLFWTQESIFLRTPHKRIFLETVLLQVCNQTNIADLDELLKNINNFKTNRENVDSSSLKKETKKSNSLSKKGFESYSDIPGYKSKTEVYTKNEINGYSDWSNFLKKISKLKDPLLFSILNQANFLGKNAQDKVVKIALNNNSSFFKDKILDSKNLWLSALQETFPDFTGFDFISIKNNESLTQNNPNSSTTKRNTFNFSLKYSKNFVDISDRDKWPKANLITKYFPGKIKLVRKLIS